MELVRLIATNGDVQAMNAGSPIGQTNLHTRTLQKVDTGEGKFVCKQSCSIKKTLIQTKIIINYATDIGFTYCRINLCNTAIVLLTIENYVFFLPKKLKVLF